ncbi:Serine/threonine-protein kinase SMG1 [Hordeum vulgare]|nr:Serine/threonine-protein kinase SMG1 [Hordeum vulgare]
MVQYIDLWRQVRHISLSDEPDKLSWHWTSSDTYSASSCYLVLFIGACEDPHWKLTWKPWAPLRIKFFLWPCKTDVGRRNALPATGYPVKRHAPSTIKNPKPCNIFLKAAHSPGM